MPIQLTSSTTEKLPGNRIILPRTILAIQTKLEVVASELSATRADRKTCKLSLDFSGMHVDPNASEGLSEVLIDGCNRIQEAGGQIEIRGIKTPNLTAAFQRAGLEAVLKSSFDGFEGSNIHPFLHFGSAGDQRKAPYTYTTEEVGDVVVMHLKGRLAGDGQGTLGRDVASELGPSKKMVLNLKEAEYAGGVQHELYQAFMAVSETAKGEIKFCCVENPKIMDNLCLCKMDEFFKIYPTQAKAIKSFGKEPAAGKSADGLKLHRTATGGYERLSPAKIFAMEIQFAETRSPTSYDWKQHMRIAAKHDRAGAVEYVVSHMEEASTARQHDMAHFFLKNANALVGTHRKLIEDGARKVNRLIHPAQGSDFAFNLKRLFSKLGM